MAARPPVRVWRLLAAAILVLTTGGCGFVSALANPPQPSQESAPTSAASSASADGSRVAARVDIAGPGGQPPGTITVTLGPEGTGVTALNSLGSSAGASCGLTEDTTRWVPFQIDFADHGSGPTKQDNAHANLAAHVAVRGSARDVGVLLGSDTGDAAACATPHLLPTADSFSTVVVSGGYHVATTGYVVARVPAGAPSSLQGATLAVTDLKKAPDDIYPPGSWTWQVERFESGSACPDSPASLCVPLG
jgi:hypothetical protein